MLGANLLEMDVDPTALDTGNPNGETPTTDLLGEEPVLNRDNPPEAADNLDDILDAVTAQPEDLVAKISSEPLMEESSAHEESNINVLPEEVTTSQPIADVINSDENLGKEQAADDVVNENSVVSDTNEPNKDNAPDEPNVEKVPSEQTVDIDHNEKNVDNASGDANMDSASNDQTVNITDEPNGNNALSEANMDNAPNEQAVSTAPDEPTDTGDNAPDEPTEDIAVNEQNEAMDTSDQMVETDVHQPLPDVVESEKPVTISDASHTKAVSLVYC